MSSLDSGAMDRVKSLDDARPFRIRCGSGEAISGEAGAGFSVRPAVAGRVDDYNRPVISSTDGHSADSSTHTERSFRR